MIKVLIDINNEGLSLRLAGRLCELSGKLSVSIRDENTDASDFDYIVQGDPGKIFPVSGLLEEIVRSYSDKTGKPFYGPGKGIRRAYYFVSPFGGSGTSSVAFTFSRLLSGKMKEKVLFMDTGRDGLIYGEFTRKAQGTIEELKYMIRNGLTPEASRFLSEDFYGPQCISLESHDFEKVSSALLKQREFTSLVLSGDPGCEGLYDETVIRVFDIRDVRHLTEDKEEGDFTVHNRDYINRVNERVISIADDPLSFKCPESSVRIAMDGEFALGVEKLMKEVTGGYEQG